MKKRPILCFSRQFICFCIIIFCVFLCTVFILYTQTQKLTLSDSLRFSKTSKQTKPVFQGFRAENKNTESDVNAWFTAPAIDSRKSLYVVQQRSGVFILPALHNDTSLGNLTELSNLLSYRDRSISAEHSRFAHLHLSQGSLLIGYSEVFDLIDQGSGSNGGDLCRKLIRVSYPRIGWLCQRASEVRRVTSGRFVRRETDKIVDVSTCQSIHLMNVDIINHDIVNLPAVTAEKCCEKCSSVGDCNAWSFTQDGTCWMKHVMDSINSKTRPKQGVLSGFLAKATKFSKQSVPLQRFKSKLSIPCCSSKADAAVNDTTLDSIGLGMQIHVDLSNKWIIHLQRKTTTWTEQWPIGNGRIGALVGGIGSREVIPLSISGLFVRRTASEVLGRSKSIFETFNAARTSMLNGEVLQAEQGLEEIVDRSFLLGMFQYVCDIGIVYGSGSMQFRNESSMNFRDNMVLPKIGAKKLMRFPINNPQGREGLVNAILAQTSCINCSLVKNGEHVFSSLNLKTGCATTEVIEYPDDIKADFRLSKREWFASEVDDVIVGRISSFATGMANDSVESSIAMMLRRENNVNMPAPLLDVAILSSPSTNYPESSSAELYMVLDSTPDISLPTTILCGVVICSNSDELSIKDNMLICNYASEILIVLSILMRSDSFSTIDEMKNRCNEKVTQAASLGFENLISRHTEIFSSKMDSLDLTFNSLNISNTCPLGELRNRLKSFGVGCAEVNVDMDSTISYKSSIESVDLQLLMQSFQYGRYLFRSSASHSVSNLQGLWADGPTSAWNGDYHMNINMQEMYSASGVASMDDTVKSLIDFVQRLSNTGKIIAETYYDCKTGNSWVSHAFTDDTMNGGVLGDTQWSLCVTCGAWLANHLFDLILFSEDYQFEEDLLNILKLKIIPLFRGIATFFIDYIIVFQGTSYTGPSTSPENSYRIRQRSSTKSKSSNESSPYENYITHIAMNPAIDISILRQVFD